MSFAVKKACAVKPATGLHEDDEGEKDGQRHDLLSGGSRQVERDHAEYGDEHGRHDEVDGVDSDTNKTRGNDLLLQKSRLKYRYA